MSLDDDNEGGNLVPGEWETCADQFLLEVRRMRMEGFTNDAILAGLCYASADLCMIEIDEE